MVQLPELRKKLVEENKTNDLDVLIEKTFEKVEMPTMEDLEEATQAINNARNTFGLNTKQETGDLVIEMERLKTTIML